MQGEVEDPPTPPSSFRRVLFSCEINAIVDLTEVCSADILGILLPSVQSSQALLGGNSRAGGRGNQTKSNPDNPCTGETNISKNVRKLYSAGVKKGNSRRT